MKLAESFITFIHTSYEVIAEDNLWLTCLHRWFCIHRCVISCNVITVLLFILIQASGKFSSTGSRLPKQLTKFDNFNWIFSLFAFYFQIFLKLSHSKCGKTLGFCLCSLETGSLIKMNLVQLLIHEASHKVAFVGGGNRTCCFLLFV